MRTRSNISKTAKRDCTVDGTARANQARVPLSGRDTREPGRLRLSIRKRAQSVTRTAADRQRDTHASRSDASR